MAVITVNPGPNFAGAIYVPYPINQTLRRGRAIVKDLVSSHELMQSMKTGVGGQPTGKIADLIAKGLISITFGRDDNASRLVSERFSIPIASPSRLQVLGVGGPTAQATGNLVYSVFTVDSSEAYRIYKVPSNYSHDGSLHIHWTKSQDSLQANNRVRWQLSISHFDGRTMNAADGSSVVLEAEDTYEATDTGATSRIVHRTDDLPFPVTPGYYLAIKIRAVTPTQDTLALPGLVSVDFAYAGFSE